MKSGTTFTAHQKFSGVYALIQLEPRRGRGGAVCAGVTPCMGGVVERLIGTACTAQDWWLARSKHFSVGELACVRVCAGVCGVLACAGGRVEFRK